MACLGEWPFFDCHVRTDIDSDFGSRIIWILVGKEQFKFNIHQSRLQNTSFFKQHGEPPTKAEKVARTAAAYSTSEQTDQMPDGPLSQVPTIKEEDGVDANSVDGEEEHDEPKLIDYHLKDSYFHERKPFEVFIRWLYSEGPGSFKTHTDCKVALKAYCLARYYHAYGLQNLLLDRFREHYKTTRIKFDDLNWIINKLGDDSAASPLTRYLIEQVAYDIADHGLAEFNRNNWFFKMYLEEGDRKIRLTLVAIIAAHAESGKGEDPAVADLDFHVGERGDQAGVWLIPTDDWLG